MIERLVNLTWIAVGAAGAVLSLQMGLFGPYGPDSGLFPFVAGILVSLSGLALLLRGETRAVAIEWPTRAGWVRIGGVLLGLAFIAATIPYLGFAAAGTVTMLILLRTVERSGWVSSILLAVASVAITLGLFVHLLGLPLPRGPWGF